MLERRGSRQCLWLQCKSSSKWGKTLITLLYDSILDDCEVGQGVGHLFDDCAEVLYQDLVLSVSD